MAEANLAVIITGRGKDLINEFHKIGRAAGESAGKTHSAWSKVSTGVKVAGAAIVGTAVAIGVSSIHMADDYEKSHARLTTALENTGTSWKAQQKAIDAVSKSATDFGLTKTDVEGALAVMTTGMGSSAKAVGALGVAEDLAAAKGIPLETAALAVTKASEGFLRPLKQMGIDLPIAAGGAVKLATAHGQLAKAFDKFKFVQDEIKSGTLKGVSAFKAMYNAQQAVSAAQDKVNTVAAAGGNILAALGQKLSGSAAAQADTFAGKVKALHAQLGNLQISIGMVLIPILLKLAQIVAKVVAWFQKHTGAAKALAVVVGGVLVAAVVAYTASMVAAAVATIAATWPILAIIAVIIILVAGIIILWTNWNKIWNWISKHPAYAALIALLTPIVALLFLIVGAAKFLQAHWVGIWSGIVAVLQVQSAAIQAYLNPILTILESIGHAARDVSDALNAIHIPGLPHSIFGHHIPGTATGGIVTRPQVRLVGEAGPEAIIPLSHANGVGGNTIHLTVQSLDPRTAATLVVEALQHYTAKNGSVPRVRVAG